MTKFPPIISPQQKVEKSKQFYNYIQEQMAQEYGIDINNGQILDKSRNGQDRKSSLPPIISKIVAQSTQFHNQETTQYIQEELYDDLAFTSCTEFLIKV
eukprot:403360212